MSLLTYSVIGASFLWPWSSLMMASVYVAPKLDNYPSLQRSYTSAVMVASTLTLLITSTFFAMRPNSYAKRIKYGEIAILISFVLMAISVVVPLKGVAWFTLLLIFDVLGSAGGSAVQNGVIAITQRIPGGSESRAMLIGQAVAGVVPPMLTLVLAASSKNTTSADSDSSSPMAAIGLFLSCSILAAASLFFFRGAEIQSHVDAAESDSNQLEEGSALPSINKIIEILEHIKFPAIAILLIFGVSLTYPVLANTVESRRIPLRFFAPLTHLAWNTGDLTGRFLYEVKALRINRGSLLVQIGVLRIVFVPILLILSRVHANDIIYLLAQLLFGVTSGHLMTSSISYAPSCVPQEQRAAAGGLLGMTISVGLLLGSLASFLVVPLIG